MPSPGSFVVLVTSTMIDGGIGEPEILCVAENPDTGKAFVDRTIDPARRAELKDAWKYSNILQEWTAHVGPTLFTVSRQRIMTMAMVGRIGPRSKYAPRKRAPKAPRA